MDIHDPSVRPHLKNLGPGASYHVRWDQKERGSIIRPSPAVSLDLFGPIQGRELAARPWLLLAVREVFTEMFRT